MDQKKGKWSNFDKNSQKLPVTQNGQDVDIFSWAIFASAGNLGIVDEKNSPRFGPLNSSLRAQTREARLKVWVFHENLF